MGLVGVGLISGLDLRPGDFGNSVVYTFVMAVASTMSMTFNLDLSTVTLVISEHSFYRRK